MGKAVIVGGLRTPIGKLGGSLTNISAVELGKTVITGLIKKTGIKAEFIDELIMGNVLQAGLGQNPARQVAIFSGIPYSCPCFTVNKVCGSGLKAITLGVSAIRMGQAKFIIAGGMENMSMAPFLIRQARYGYKLGHGELSDSLIGDGLWDVFNNSHMGLLAEYLAKGYNISREEQDTFAYKSQLKYQQARKEDRFLSELIPVSLKEQLFSIDEYPRETSLEKLASLKPAFNKDGTVTAGNASGINDGAAALLLADEDEAKKSALPRLASIRDFVSIGLEPRKMGLGPVVAIKKILERNGLSKEEVDLYEINEAFASQMIAVIKELNLNEEKVNVNGGAIALGHPIGASGARIVVTLMHELIRRQGRLGLASLCIGGGMGMAILIERVANG